MNRPESWREELATPLHALQGELHRLFDRYRSTVTIRPRPDAHADRGHSAWTPALDLYETPDEIGLVVDLPGVDPSTIEVSVTGTVLTLSGATVEDLSVRGRGGTLERSFGPFRRQVVLPGAVDVERIEAESSQGVLSVRLPRADAARPRTIPIRTA